MNVVYYTDDLIINADQPVLIFKLQSTTVMFRFIRDSQFGPPNKFCELIFSARKWTVRFTYKGQKNIFFQIYVVVLYIKRSTCYLIYRLKVMVICPMRLLYCNRIKLQQYLYFPGACTAVFSLLLKVQLSGCNIGTTYIVARLECPAKSHPTDFQRNFTELFNFAGIKLQNSVKFRRIPLNAEFRKIRIPPDLFSTE